MKTRNQQTTILRLAILMAAILLVQACVAAQIHGLVCLESQGAIGMEGVIVALTGPNDMMQITNTGRDGKYRFTVSVPGAYTLTYRRTGKCLVSDPQKTNLVSRSEVVAMPPVCAFNKSRSSLSANDATEAIILRATMGRDLSLADDSVQNDLSVLKKDPSVSAEIMGQIVVSFRDKPIRQRIEDAKFPEITAGDLQERIRQKRPTMILDANGSSFYKLCHIPGAINYEAARGNIRPLLQANSQVVAYCGPLGLKAKGCAENLIGLGFTNVVRLRGGLPGWVDFGGEVLRSTE